jgi:C-terminal processing protease CtpA/Prc
MTRATYTLAAGLALILAAAMGLQAAAQEKKDSPPPSNDSQQQNANANSPGASDTSPSQTDQQNAAPQKSQNSDSERANTNQNQPQNNANDTSNSQRAQNNGQDDRAPRESNDNRRDNRDSKDQTQSVLKSPNREGQTNQDARDSNRGPTTSERRDSNRDFRRDFKFGKSTDRGLAVSTLGRNSIFYRAGLRDNDIIISYGGRPIRSQDDFFRFAVYQPGQRIPIVVWRDGREQTIYVVYDQDEGTALLPSGDQNIFGAEFDPRSNDGALIIRVQPGSPAHKAGLMANDFVVALNGDRVSSGRDAIDIVQSLSPGERLQVEYERHARVDVVLGDSRSDRNVDSASYQTTDRPTSVAVGVDADGAQDRNRNDNTDRDRRDNRREGRGILPRLRN